MVLSEVNQTLTRETLLPSMNCTPFQLPEIRCTSTLYDYEAKRRRLKTTTKAANTNNNTNNNNDNHDMPLNKMTKYENRVDLLLEVDGVIATGRISFSCSPHPVKKGRRKYCLRGSGMLTLWRRLTSPLTLLMRASTHSWWRVLSLCSLSSTASNLRIQERDTGFILDEISHSWYWGRKSRLASTRFFTV